MGTRSGSARTDAQRNRDAILESAVDVLAQTPTASLAEVAARAGLGRATLYRHFPSRDALLAAIREEALARARAALAEAGLADASARDGVRRAAQVLVPLGMRFRILLAEGADADPDFVAARTEALQPLLDVVARGIADGELDPAVPPGWAAVVLAGLLMSAVRAAAAGIVGVADAAELVAVSFFDGLGSRAG
jgi:AcrR family transcriptional regulator